MKSQARSGRWVVVVVTAAVFTDMLMYDMVVPFLPQYMRKWQITEGGIGVFFAAYSAAMLLATPLAGWWCDRRGGQRPLFVGAALLCAATVLYALAGNFALLLAARILQGLAGAISWTAGLTLLAHAFSPEERGRAMGTAMSGISLGTLVGPPLGGLLYDWGGYRLPFLLAAALAGIVALLVRFLAAPGEFDSSSELLPWKEVLRHAGMRFVLAAVVLGAAILTLLEPTLPLDLEQRLGASPRSIGLLFGAAVLAYGLASPLAGLLSDRIGRERVVLAGLASAAASLPLLALPASYFAETIVLALFGIACALLLSPTLPYLADVLDRRGSKSYGTAYALFNLAYGIGMIVGPIAGSLLAESFGFFVALSAASAICGVYLIAYFSLLRRTRTMTAE